MDWLIEKGFLVSPDLIDSTESQIKNLKELVLNGTLNPEKISVLSKDILSETFNNDTISDNSNEKHHLSVLKGEYNPEYKVQVITNYQEESINRKVQDFVKFLLRENMYNQLLLQEQNHILV
jgi:hypothetical protein